MQTFYYPVVSNYLTPGAFFLVLWMALIPIPSIRLIPANVLNAAAKKVGLPKNLKFSTFVVVLSALMFVMEFLDMNAKEKAYLQCKSQAVQSMDNCAHYRAQKWRSERNFYMVALHLFLEGLVHLLAVKAENDQETAQYKAQVKYFVEKNLFGRVSALFNALDADSNGTLNFSEMHKVHGSDKSLHEFFDVNDKDKSDELDTTEFAKYFMNLYTRKGEKCVDIVLEHWTKTAQKKSS